MIYDELSIAQKIILIEKFVKYGLKKISYKYYSSRETLLYGNFELDFLDLSNLDFVDSELLKELEGIDWNSKLFDLDFEIMLIKDDDINMDYGIFTLNKIVSKIFRIMNESYLMYYEKFGGFEIVDIDEKITLNIILSK